MLTFFLVHALILALLLVVDWIITDDNHTSIVEQITTFLAEVL